MIDSFVYFLGDDAGRVKIGRSRLPLARMGKIARSNGHAIELIGVIRGGKALESALHVCFAYLRIPSDLSLGDGRTEWFTLDDALSAYIDANAQPLPDDVPIKKETFDALQDMARELGYAAPSPAAFLDALALAYRADPAAVIRAMQSIGVVNVTTPADE